MKIYNVPLEGQPIYLRSFVRTFGFLVAAKLLAVGVKEFWGWGVDVICRVGQYRVLASGSVGHLRDCRSLVFSLLRCPGEGSSKPGIHRNSKLQTLSSIVYIRSIKLNSPSLLPAPRASALNPHL